MTSSSTTSAGLIPLNPSPSDPSLNPPPPEDSSSFGDVMQQHSDSSTPANSQNQTAAASNAGSDQPSASTGTNPDGSAASSDANADNTPATPQPVPMKGGGGGGHGKNTPQAQPSNTTTAATATPSGTLKSMLIRASVLANANSATPTLATASAKDAATAPDTTSTDAEKADLSGLIAQAFGLSANTKPAMPAAKTKSDAGKDTTTTTATPSNTTAPDLSTLMAQALILAANGHAGAAAVTGKNVASAATGNAIAGASTKEKKSAAVAAEGSFLQSGTTGTTTALDLLRGLGPVAAVSAQAASSQTFATSADPKKSAGDFLAKVNAATAGTANVEKRQTMNADQNLPGLLNGTGTTTGPQQTISDMQIKLSSNTNFENALKTVLHVASLNEVSQTGGATRVTIELQTPPGAIVNVYVTKSNDQWRAQLSTNDPAALSWVQDKVTSLKQTTDAGVEVKWLPPQLDTTAASAGGDANLGWDRGGQGQSQYQRDENNQPGQPDDDSDLATAGASFMDSLTASGRFLVIPAILAAPLVQGVVGGVVGSVANIFAPSTPPPASLTSDPSARFGPCLNRASAATAASGPVASATGSMHSTDWSTMSSSDVKSWGQSLAGKHVDASDNSGRTISGTVDGVQMLGGTLAFNIGGHLVSLSQLKQISWSPSIA